MNMTMKFDYASANNYDGSDGSDGMTTHSLITIIIVRTSYLISLLSCSAVMALLCWLQC